jgi:hypothetical protein
MPGMAVVVDENDPAAVPFDPHRVRGLHIGAADAAGASVGAAGWTRGVKTGH